MGKITTILIMVILIVVIAAAVNKKGVFEYLNQWIKKPPIPDTGRLKNQLSNKQSDIGQTIHPPELGIIQLNADGTSFFEQYVTKKDMRDKNDVMVGLSISRPGVDCDGIRLHGKRKKDGTFDEDDPSTYAALTVNAKAVCIGYDEAGFYGEVTNPNASVYEVVGNKKTKPVAYGGHFDINDGTCILIGRQWIRFKIPSLPEFPGAKIAGGGRVNATDTASEAPVQVPTVKIDKPKGMKRRILNTKEPQAVSDTENYSNISIRFPTDE